ncbi:MAG TPA: divalent metal cation transporter [Anaerolineales bacterium]|nr:divalent metal cation transporter [Anaerolineales bacterium]
MQRIREFFRILGPGFISGASDDDPSGIGTYSQTGAQFGYSQLWTALFTTPFMIVIQEICGRIGMVTGKGLAGVIRTHYARPILTAAVLLLFVSNTINIGADLGAMAASGQLVVRLPFIPLLLAMTLLTLALQIFVPYRTYSKYLKYLGLALLVYIATAFVIRVDWKTIAATTIVPSVSSSRAYLMNIVAILGTSISPYLFFWQAAEEVEEQVSAGKQRDMGVGKPRVTMRGVREMRLDTVLGMIFSSLVMWFIIITTAATLHTRGLLDVQTADQAARALQPMAGSFASLLFALGIVGTGLLAVPVLAGSASYGIAEALGWKEGLYRKLTQAYGFYGVIAAATVIGLLINFSPVKPFQMLYYSAILNGLTAPPLIVLVVVIGNNDKIMGKHTNPRWSNIGGWVIAGVMGAAAVALLFSLGSG